MIDVWMVARNGLWIAGSAISLAAVSYHHWLASLMGRRWSDVFRDESFRLAWFAGLFLACVGWAFAQAQWWWDRPIWLAGAAAFGWEAARAIRRMRRPPAGASRGRGE